VTTSPLSFDLARAGNALQLDVALESVGGDTELFGEILAMFLHDVPSYLRDARRGLSEGALVRVGRAAHTVRGTGAQLGASALASAALDVERCALAGNVPAVKASLAILERAAADLFHALGAELEPASSAA